MNNKKFSKAGFTLLEILIAVLIIGVLTTIALPMYQGAADKSKWARLIAPARAVSTAQEAAYMNQGGYTANIEDLDVSLPEGNDMTYTLYTTTNGDDANFIRIVSSQLNDVRLAKYYKNNEGFEDQLYCEAKNGNERANKLCGKLLKGQELISTDDDYKMYLVEERANEVLCNRMELWWSKNFTNCYLTEEQRCTANTMPYGGGLCGWTDTSGQTINEGGKCEGTVKNGCKGSVINDGGVCEGGASSTCSNSIINAGGECISTASGCHGSTINDGGICRVSSEATYGCEKVTINSGGQCIAEGGRVSCDQANVYDGGKCIGEAGGYATCRQAKIYDGGVCEGNGGNLDCLRVQVYDGGKCIGNGGTSPCYETKIHDGGQCVGNSNGACNYIQVDSGGTCEGNANGSCNGTLGNGFQDGSVCNGNVSGACKGKFQAGSTCNGKSSGACNATGQNFYGTCNGLVAGSCGTGKTAANKNVTFSDGAVCNGQVSGSCKGIFDSGSRCVANVAGACAGTYQNGGCCEGGDNCPANAPRC